MRLELLAALNAERDARRACLLVTDLQSGEGRMVPAAAVDKDPQASALAHFLATGRSGMVEGTRLFVTVFRPPPRLLLMGAVHISQALAPMARLAGFDVTVMDPRTAFATPERFPDAPLIAEWPDVALPDYKLDAFTGLAALTHDPKLDEPALVAALQAGSFYVGALGSRRTHAKRVERLLAAGISEAALARIHAPIGMNIGASSPAEIAVAVLAEVIAAFRKPSGAEAGR